MLRAAWPAAPVLALTATATTAVAADIERSLGLRLRGRFFRARGVVDRPNLRLDVLPRSKREDDLRLIRRCVAASSAIVYCQTRDAAESLALELAVASSPQVSARPYHAGLSPQERARVQAAFLAGSLQVVVATLAFGQGVDAPHVRCIVHYGLPSSLEAYAQEIGRAGRDGEPARCVLLWGPGDVVMRRRLARDCLDPARAERALESMVAYVNDKGCLRAHVARFFDDPGAQAECQERGGEVCCGCRVETPAVFADYTSYAQRLLAVAAVVRAGAAKQVNFLVGAKDKATGELLAKYGPRWHGCGAEKPAAFWAALHQQLRVAGFVDVGSHGGCAPSALGRKALSEGDGAAPIVLPELVWSATPPRPPKRPRRT